MGGFDGSFQLPGGIALRLARARDEDFLFGLFIEARPWLSWVEGGRDLIRTLYQQQYRAMQTGKDAAYPEHLDLVIERLGGAAGRIVVDLGPGDWRIAELQVAAAARRVGIGSNVVRGLQLAASRAGVGLSVSAPIFGSESHRLYSLLGFRVCTIDGPLYQMAWHPTDASTPGEGRA